MLFSLSAAASAAETFTLTVKVSGLRNSKGALVFTLYNKAGSIPDEHFKHFYKQKSVQVNDNSAVIIFKNLPKGAYAVNILHDENKNGKIDKGFIFPVEGIGFSNYKDIGLSNRPNFKNASFPLDKDKEITVKVIYF